MPNFDNLHFNARSIGVRGDFDHSLRRGLARDGIHRVHEHVDEHLLQLDGIAQIGGRPAARTVWNPGLPLDDLAVQDIQRGIHQLIQIDTFRSPFALLKACERG